MTQTHAPITLYHNPKCSKSRETLALLRNRGQEPDIVLYLQAQLDQSTFTALKQTLGLSSVRQMMRTKEALYQELKLDNADLSEQALLDALTANPSLLERPIAVRGQRAVIGRPPENVLTLL